MRPRAVVGASTLDLALALREEHDVHLELRKLLRESGLDLALGAGDAPCPDADLDEPRILGGLLLQIPEPNRMRLGSESPKEPSTHELTVHPGVTVDSAPRDHLHHRTTRFPQANLHNAVIGERENIKKNRSCQRLPIEIRRKSK